MKVKKTGFTLLVWTAVGLTFAAPHFINDGANAAESRNEVELTLELDRSTLSTYKEGQLSSLQEEGRIPSLVVYVNTEPVEYLGKSFTLRSGTNTIRVGVPQIIDRPLYMFDVIIDGGTISFGRLSQTELSIDKRESSYLLVLEDIFTPELDTKQVDENHYTVYLTPEPYDRFSQWATEFQIDALKPTGFVPTAYRRPKSNQLLPSILELAEQEGSTALLQTGIPEGYKSVVDTKWATLNFQFIFDPPHLTPLRIESTPIDGVVRINGIRNNANTNTRIEAIRTVWSKISISKNGYRTCWLKESEVVPPNEAPSGIHTFHCNLDRQK